MQVSAMENFMPNKSDSSTMCARFKVRYLDIVIFQIFSKCIQHCQIPKPAMWHWWQHQWDLLHQRGVLKQGWRWKRSLRGRIWDLLLLWIKPLILEPLFEGAIIMGLAHSSSRHNNEIFFSCLIYSFWILLILQLALDVERLVAKITPTWLCQEQLQVMACQVAIARSVLAMTTSVR